MLQCRSKGNIISLSLKFLQVHRLSDDPVWKASVNYNWLKSVLHIVLTFGHFPLASWIFLSKIITAKLNTAT